MQDKCCIVVDTISLHHYYHHHSHFRITLTTASMPQPEGLRETSLESQKEKQIQQEHVNVL